METQIYHWLKYLKLSKNFQKIENVDIKYKLIYFNIPGLAEPIRWMFRISNANFDEERIDLDKWCEEKYRKLMQKYFNLIYVTILIVQVLMKF